MLILPALLPSLPTFPLRLEAEGARVASARVASERGGFSGTGYVTDLTAPDARVEFATPEMKAGLYRVRVGFATPGGTKGFEVSANGRRYGGRFPASASWTSLDAGPVELKAGVNAIGIERGWGYYDLDYIELTPLSAPPTPKPVPPRLTDPKATPEARALMATLARHYGKATMLGQYEWNEVEGVRAMTGKTPAIVGEDLIEYSPSRIAHGSDPKNLMERIVARGPSRPIETLCWHWNAPFGLLDRMDKDAQGKEVDHRWYRGFYTEATTFDVAKAANDPNSPERKAILSDIDAIAIQLKKLQAGKVPVLFRPLHEASGGWFWWGAKGPQPCLWLWKTLRERLIGHHGLHNLIWVWNSPEPEWYPGDDAVDIVAIDEYPADRHDPLAAAWERLLARYDGKKILAIGEFPGPSDVPRAFRFGARWSYTVSWTGNLGPKGSDPDFVRSVYASPLSLTRDEIGP